MKVGHYATGLHKLFIFRYPVHINCEVLASAQNRRELNGTLLLRDKVFRINGNANLIGSLPVKVLITFTPQDNSVPLTFQYNLETTLKGYGLVGSLSYSNRLTRFSGNATANDKFNWEINLQVIKQTESFTYSLRSLLYFSQL